jgi:hypothetical protein
LINVGAREWEIQGDGEEFAADFGGGYGELLVVGGDDPVKRERGAEGEKLFLVFSGDSGFGEFLDASQFGLVGGKIEVGGGWWSFGSGLSGKDGGTREGEEEKCEG